MDSVFLDLGVIKIQSYSITFLLALIVGGFLALRESKKFGISEDFMINMFFFLIPISILGARVYYVIFNWDYYSANPLSIVKIWEGGLAIHGGLIFGFAWIVFYCYRYKVRTLRILDIMAPSLLIGQAIGRWGNFFNSEAYGPITTSEHLKSLFIPDFIIDGMYINGEYHHPTFLYESLWCLIGFIIILLIRKYKYLKIGQLACVYLIWSGIGRFFVEALRQDSLMLGSLKMAQLVSISMVIIGIIFIIVFNRGSKLDNRYNDKENVDAVKF